MKTFQHHFILLIDLILLLFWSFCFILYIYSLLKGDSRGTGPVDGNCYPTHQKPMSV